MTESGNFQSKSGGDCFTLLTWRQKGRPRSRAKAQISREEVASAEMVPHTVMINSITVITVAPPAEPTES